MAPTLVTGATGFVGSHLTRRLVTSGQSVRVVVRNRERMAILGPVAEQVQVAVADVLDPVAITRAMEGVGHVYHCAAHVGFGPGQAKRLMSVNVRGTANVVNAALRSGVERLVHTSSIAALGRSEQTRGCLDETAVWVESPLNTEYARSKHLAELEVYRAIAEGLDAVLVNPSLIMGPAQPGENTMQIAERVQKGQILAIPAGATNVVDVEDVVTGHLAAMEFGDVGERYLLAGENLSWSEILGTLARELEVGLPSRRISGRVALWLGSLFEVISFITRKPPLISRDSARLTSHKTCYENTKAREALGLSFRPFSETAARMAEVLRA